MVSKWSKDVNCYCEECGHGWEISRGESFVCPYCYNAPEEVIFRGSLAVLEWDGTPRFDGRPR